MFLPHKTLRPGEQNKLFWDFYSIISDCSDPNNMWGTSTTFILSQILKASLGAAAVSLSEQYSKFFFWIQLLLESRMMSAVNYYKKMKKLKIRKKTLWICNLPVYISLLISGLLTWIIDHLIIQIRWSVIFQWILSMPKNRQWSEQEKITWREDREKEEEEGKKSRNVFPHTTLMPPEFSRLHIPSSGAMPIVVPLNVTPLSHREKTRETEWIMT